MSTFSRVQKKTLLLVAALFLGLYAGRSYLGRFSLHAAAPTSTFVEVSGEVARPGVFAFPAPPALPEVWRLARGPEPVPVSAAVLPSQTCLAVGHGGEYALGRINGERLLTMGQALDLNTATAEDLDALPGIGPALAQRIIQYRESAGPFKSVEDLLAVHGMGKKKLAQLRSLVVVSGSAD